MKETMKRSGYHSVRMETRVDDDGGKKLVLRGYPIVFNSETEIYDFWLGEVRETILPTALDGTDLSNVYLLVGHNPDNLLGRTNVNLRLEVDETGLFMECVLPNTQLARDTYNLVESGILDGMSFGFDCSDEINAETKIRTITHIDTLYEITLTPFPAYKLACAVAQNGEQTTETEPVVEEEKAEDDAVDEEKLSELEELLSEEEEEDEDEQES